MDSAPSNSKANRRMWMSYLMKYGVPLVISVGLCYLLFTGVNFSEMMEIIRHNCNYWWIGAALAMSILSHVVRAMRWRIQLRAIGVTPPLWVLVLSIFGTYAMNLVLPRLGELWRTGYIAQRQKAPFDKVFGSMVADRLSDTVTVLLITAVTFIFAGPSLMAYLKQNPESYLRLVRMATSPWTWGAIVAIVAAVVALLRLFPQNPLILKVKDFVRGLWKGFAVVAVMPGKGRWLLLTLMLWGCYFFQLYLCFFSFPATTQVVHTYGTVAVAVCFVLTSISMGVPSNGGIGPWQWAMIFGLMMYSRGIPELTQSYATSFANLVMGSQTLLLILLGLFTFICISLDKRRKPTQQP
ncbi:MAG: flippase-like domain-containing protein [Muribaculaceae bacterium]|nr:flippase-like domain-containing protein [Muribaculaceae bacterium]